MKKQDVDKAEKKWTLADIEETEKSASDFIANYPDVVESIKNDNGVYNAYRHSGDPISTPNARYVMMKRKNSNIPTLEVADGLFKTRETAVTAGFSNAVSHVFGVVDNIYSDTLGFLYTENDEGAEPITRTEAENLAREWVSMSPPSLAKSKQEILERLENNLQAVLEKFQYIPQAKKEIIQQPDMN